MTRQTRTSRKVRLDVRVTVANDALVHRSAFHGNNYGRTRCDIRYRLTDQKYFLRYTPGRRTMRRATCMMCLVDRHNYEYTLCLRRA